ncbi:MAG: hypothetical protein JKX79_11745 [Labilibaculum sp.]|nr:hypothetical protein [Labilibaculum sp.]
MKKIGFLVAFLICGYFGYSQDIIVMNDGNELKCNIREVTNSVIKFAEVDETKNVIRQLAVADVYLIIYEDGKREFIKKSEKSSNYKNLDNTVGSEIVSKNNLDVRIIDARSESLIIGRVPGLIRGTKMKVKDKKNKWIESVHKLLKERLDKKGIKDNSEAEYYFDVELNKLYFEQQDKFTHIQIIQKIEAKITLRNIDNKNIVFEKNIVQHKSTKAAVVRKYCKLNGYKLKQTGCIFLYVIDDMISELNSDTTFNKIIQ